VKAKRLKAHRKGAKDAKIRREKRKIIHRLQRFEGFPEKSSESF
jgi:hypothetical protein